MGSPETVSEVVNINILSMPQIPLLWVHYNTLEFPLSAKKSCINPWELLLHWKIFTNVRCNWVSQCLFDLNQLLDQDLTERLVPASRLPFTDRTDTSCDNSVCYWKVKKGLPNCTANGFEHVQCNCPSTH